MKKSLVSMLMIILILISCCSRIEVAQTPPEESAVRHSTEKTPALPETFLDSSEVTWTFSEDKNYTTIRSNGNKIGIVRKLQPADYSFIHPVGLTEIPVYNPDSGEMWQVDLRSTDVTRANLDGRLDDLLYAAFDSKTQWPEKLPDGFDPDKIMELGKNPGLGIGKLHRQGITGKGVGLAIIDQGLLTDHVEYKDQLRMYEEIHSGDKMAQMHGPAVASIAVGKSVGVAPDADLYYIASTFGTYDGKDGFEYDLTWIARCIERIVEVNKMLAQDRKIRVISISLGIGGQWYGYEQALAAIEAAEKEGIYTVYVGSDKYWGLGREPMKDPDEFTSYEKGIFWRMTKMRETVMLIPMDSRCTASPTGVNDYVFYREGGMSWSVPYVAGLYALACQVKPDITPEIFWEAAEATGVSLYEDNSETEIIGKVINPVALIESLR